MTRKCSLCRQEGHQRNQCSNSPFGGAFVHSIKSVDDTPVGESDESDDAVYRWLTNLEARIVELEKAFKRAKAADRTYLISIRIQQHQWTPGDAWWDVGVPEVSDHESVRQARADHMEGKQNQRVGV